MLFAPYNLGSYSHTNIMYLVIYFPRQLKVFMYSAIVIKSWTLYAHVSNLFLCKSSILMWQNNSLIFYINTFFRNFFTISVDRGCAWEWMIGVSKAEIWKIEGLHCCRFACTFDAQIYTYKDCCLTIIGWHFACFAILNACDHCI